MLPNFGPFAKDKTEFICQAEDSVWRSCGNPQVAELVSGALQLIRADGLKVVAGCGFVVDYLRKHPEYGDIVG